MIRSLFEPAGYVDGCFRSQNHSWHLPANQALQWNMATTTNYRLYSHILGYTHDKPMPSHSFFFHWIVHPWYSHDLPVAQDWGFVQRLDLETDGPILAAKTWRAQRMLQASCFGGSTQEHPTHITNWHVRTRRTRRTRPAQQLIVDLFAFQNARSNSPVIYL